MSESVSVLLADDQRLVRESLATMLGLLDGVELVGTAADGEEACELARMAAGPAPSLFDRMRDLASGRGVTTDLPLSCTFRSSEWVRRT